MLWGLCVLGNLATHPACLIDTNFPTQISCNWDTYPGFSKLSTKNWVSYISIIIVMWIVFLLILCRFLRVSKIVKTEFHLSVFTFLHHSKLYMSSAHGYCLCFCLLLFAAKALISQAGG